MPLTKEGLKTLENEDILVVLSEDAPHTRRFIDICYHMKKLGIIGCGWLGIRIADSLQAAFEIHATVTKSAKLEELSAAGFNPEVIDLDQPGVDRWNKTDDLDAIIITVPLFSKRVGEMELAVRRANLLQFLSGFSGPMLMMSSIGIYPDKTGQVTEKSLSPEDAPGEREVYCAFPQVTILRLGGLMGDDRQLKNYQVSAPNAPVNHVHFQDVVNVVQKLLAIGVVGKVYNMVAPLHPTKAAVICAQKGRIDDVPTAKTERIVSSQLIISDLNYNFEYPDPAHFPATQL